jgi:hypothetical protein
MTYVADLTFTANLGTVVRIGKAPTPILVKDAGGALVDPATITVTALRPDGTTTTPATPTRETTGTYHHDYEPPFQRAMAGLHRCEVVTTNPDATFRIDIYFNPSPFAP